MDIFTTGYPRSGNTWLNRLLSDLLRAPMQTNPRDNIQYFGPPGEMAHDYVIRKTHWRSKDMPRSGFDGEPRKIVFIQRDPRDVAVSAMFYKGCQPNLYRMIQAMADPDFTPHDKRFRIYHEVGVYERFVREWIADPLVFQIRYEALHRSVSYLRAMTRWVTGVTPSVESTVATIERQAFSQHAPKFPSSMRKGIIGDWKNYFTRETGELIEELLGDFMREMGYTTSRDWWKSL